MRKKEVCLRFALIGVSAVILAVILTVVLPGCNLSKKTENPVILLRSGWQVENIGDVAHTPGFLALVEEYIPEAKVIFWPHYGLLPESEVTMLYKQFPKLTIVQGVLSETGEASTPELSNAISKASIFIHNSGPATISWKEALLFKELTGKPFGVYGVTYGLYGIPEKQALREAAFVYFRDTVSLDRAKQDGIDCPIMEWAPDAAFATYVTDDDKALAYLKENGLEVGKYICCIPNHRRTPVWKHAFKNRPFDEAIHTYNEAMKEHDHAPMIEAIIEIVRQTDLKVLIVHEDETELAIGKEWIWDNLPEDVKPRVVWRSTYWTVEEAVSIYKHSVGLFSHEMHSPIMCIANDIPAIVVRWKEQSSKGYMWQTIGLNDWLFDFDEEEDIKRYVPAVLDMAINLEASKLKAKKAKAFVNKRQKETMGVVKSTMSQR